MGTRSWIASLPERDRAEVLSRLRKLVAGEAPVEVRYGLEVHWACRR